MSETKEIDSSEAVELASKAAHELAIKECERLNTINSRMMNDEVYFAHKALDIFKRFYTQEYEKLEQKFKINLNYKPGLPEGSHKNQSIMKTTNKNTKEKPEFVNQLVMKRFSKGLPDNTVMIVKNSYGTYVGKVVLASDKDGSNKSYRFLNARGQIMETFNTIGEAFGHLISKEDDLLRDAYYRHKALEAKKVQEQTISKEPVITEQVKPIEKAGNNQENKRQEELSQLREEKAQELAKEQKGHSLQR